MRNLIKLLVVFAVVFSFMACKSNTKNDDVEDIPIVKIEDEMDMDKSEYTPKGPDFTLESVYFAFDKYDLTPDAKQAIRRNSMIIKEKHMPLDVAVEGHCDERGTIAYNIALGERRAKVVKDEYVKNGVSLRTINTISYGKERPLCFDATESCWSQNRRSETKLYIK